MNLDEAIKHCEEVADTPCFTDEEARCYTEHRQLAEWLKELKAYKEQSGDVISRDKAIVQLSHLLSDWDDDWNVGIRKCIETVKSVKSVSPQALEQSEKKNYKSEARRWKRRYFDLKQQTRWIPVSERLPEERGVYLVTQKAIFPGHVFRRIVCYAPNLHDVNEYDFKGKERAGWYEYDSEWGYWELDDVIAWMPLPEPYKAESEE